jgi:hypothetical protein
MRNCFPRWKRSSSAERAQKRDQFAVPTVKLSDPSVTAR